MERLKTALFSASHEVSLSTTICAGCVRVKPQTKGEVSVLVC